MRRKPPEGHKRHLSVLAIVVLAKLRRSLPCWLAGMHNRVIVVSLGSWWSLRTHGSLHVCSQVETHHLCPPQLVFGDSGMQSNLSRSDRLWRLSIWGEGQVLEVE